MLPDRRVAPLFLNDAYGPSNDDRVAFVRRGTHRLADGTKSADRLVAEGLRAGL